MIHSGRNLLGSLVWGILLAVLSGCASERIVLLPNSDGKPSAVIVKTKSGEQVIDRPYESVSLTQNGTISRHTETPEYVHAHYSAALDAQPQRAESYIVYFISGKNEITPESQAVVDQMQTDLKTRSAPEIVVVGHTDRVGTVEFNDTLSLERANVMRDLLIANGISAEHIEAAGRGEREPLVPTEDEVDEPRNRRVEIIVR